MNQRKWRRGVSLLLAVLFILACSVTALAAGNDAETLELGRPGKSKNIAFAVENMFPGDVITQDFTVEVDHKKPITLYYHADVRPGYETLAEVLMVRVELPEQQSVLYDGLMGEMPQALEQPLAADTTEVTYRITAYLDTSVGNDYQYQSLVADFCWWYEKEVGGTSEPEPPKRPGFLDNPKTGDISARATYMVLLAGALAIVLFLFLWMKRKKEGRADE